MEQEITLETEHNSYTLADFLLDEMSKSTGVKRREFKFLPNESKKAA